MKKLLSLFLSAVMFLSMPVAVFATDGETTITAYVTISKYGEFVTTKDGDDAVLLPVELSEKSEYTLDDLFSKTHELYYSTSDGYFSASGDYGAYITKFWGDESGNFGYQVNGGTESVMGLTHLVEDGDYVDVAIYKNLYPDTESYSVFDKYRAQITTGEGFELTLNQAGYDENWNTVFSACEGASITINGSDAEITTDSNGTASICFDKAGTYIVSAYESKTVRDESVPSITAPICVVTVRDPDYITIIHNIAKKYSDTILTSDANMIWLVADMAIYNELYPESEYVLTDSLKQACLDKIVEDATKSTTASVLAKSILALRALGYDARNIYDSDSAKFDLVNTLTTLIDNQDAAVTNIYTLPYVIIALSQAEGYATEEQMNYLINSAILSKDSWQSTEWGTDAATAMLLSLAPYYSINDDIKNIIDETIPLVTSAQTETGLIGNAASTGIAITALSALGIDSQTISSNEKNLIDGLMTQATDTLEGFEPMENSFSTEQGFRGLLAWQLFARGTNRIMYDFSSYPRNNAFSTRKPTPVIRPSGGGGNKKPAIQDTPKEEEVIAPPKEEIIEKPENKNPDVKVMPIVVADKTFDDIAEHENKTKIEALAKRNIINGKTPDTYEPHAAMTRAEFATIITRGLGLSVNNTSEFKDITEDDWFYTYINTAYHYGIIKGISETEFNPNGVVTRQEAATMVARAATLCGMNTEMDADEIRDVLAVFTDYTQVESWAKDSMAFCYSNGIIPDEEIEISPASKITRAEVASMVYNMLDKSGLLQEESK